MLEHNLKLILRTIWSRKIYSLVIFFSLTVGFVCSNILISFLVFETNTDSFHTKHGRIFQLLSNDPFGGSGQIAFIPRYFKDYLESGYAEADEVCQVAAVDGVIITQGATSIEGFNTLSVDSSFFAVFDFPLLHGAKNNAVAPGTIILSREKAVALFGRTDVVDRTITVSTADTTRELTISAVLDKRPENSHLRFDVLMHHTAMKAAIDGGATYVQMNSADQKGLLQEKVNRDPQRPGLIGKGNMDYFFYPLKDSYFNVDNKMGFMKIRNPVFLKVGYVVCGLVLFIAGFNFMNLFLLSWQNRRKEVGIKKTLGVTKQALFAFSMVEAGVYVAGAFVVSLVITFYLIPLFNIVFEAGLTSAYFLNIKVVVLVAGVLFVTGCLVILLSVLKQWHMKPVSLMSRDGSKASFSRMLFTIQFVISATLAICAVTIMRQMNHIENAPLGFNRHIIQLDAPDKKTAEALPVLKQKLLQLPGVMGVTVSSGNPIFGNMIVRYDLDHEQFYSPYVFSGDQDYIAALNLQVIQGRIPSGDGSEKLVNETLVKMFGMANPVGAPIPGTKDVIAGVVKDFTCGSFKQQIPPVIISMQHGGRSLLISYAGDDLAQTLPQVQQAWNSIFAEYPFSYRLLQEELMKKYREDTFFYKIVVTFSVISIVLSCFGLFALSWAVVQSRTKEMGIRKVLGATALDIANLLTVTFTKRILLAFAIAAPIGYYVMDEWLARFANKIEMNAWIFVLSALIVIFIALLTLSLQTIKATMANPVDEIRTE